VYKAIFLPVGTASSLDQCHVVAVRSMKILATGWMDYPLFRSFRIGMLCVTYLLIVGQMLYSIRHCSCSTLAGVPVCNTGMRGKSVDNGGSTRDFVGPWMTHGSRKPELEGATAA